MTDDTTYGEAVDETVDDINDTIAELRHIRDDAIADASPIVRWLMTKWLNYEIRRLQRGRDALKEKRRKMPFGLESAGNFAFLKRRDDD